jgi:serine/threonine protein phosphatase PrpC
VIASDGVWDVMSNEEVVDFFGDKLGFTGTALSHVGSVSVG